MSPIEEDHAMLKPSSQRRGKIHSSQTLPLQPDRDLTSERRPKGGAGRGCKRVKFNSTSGSTPELVSSWVPLSPFIQMHVSSGTSQGRGVIWLSSRGSQGLGGADTCQISSDPGDREKPATERLRRQKNRRLQE